MVTEVSQASAEQRTGRGGRVRAGKTLFHKLFAIIHTETFVIDVILHNDLLNDIKLHIL